MAAQMPLLGSGYWPVAYWPVLPPAYRIGEQNIMTLIMGRMRDFLWYRLHDLVGDDDPCRLDTCKVGYRQESPKGIVLLIYENDVMNPRAAAHRPDAYPAGYPGTEGQTVVHRGQRGRELLGGGRSFEYQRYVTLQLEVWLQKLGLSIQRTEKRDYLDEISGTVRGRVAHSLMEGGPTIGFGMGIEDSFGEYVVDGPFFEEEWAERQVGESATTMSFMRLWYRTTRETT